MTSKRQEEADSAPLLGGRGCRRRERWRIRDVVVVVVVVENCSKTDRVCQEVVAEGGKAIGAMRVEGEGCMCVVRSVVRSVAVSAGIGPQGGQVHTFVQLLLRSN